MTMFHCREILGKAFKRLEHHVDLTITVAVDGSLHPLLVDRPNDRIELVLPASRRDTEVLGTAKVRLGQPRGSTTEGVAVKHFHGTDGQPVILFEIRRLKRLEHIQRHHDNDTNGQSARIAERAINRIQPGTGIRRGIDNGGQAVGRKCLEGRLDAGHQLIERRRGLLRCAQCLGCRLEQNAIERAVCSSQKSSAGRVDRLIGDTAQFQGKRVRNRPVTAGMNNVDRVFGRNAIKHTAVGMAAQNRVFVTKAKNPFSRRSSARLFRESSDKRGHPISGC